MSKFSLPWNCIPGCRTQWHETISQLVFAPYAVPFPLPHCPEVSCCLAPLSAASTSAMMSFSPFPWIGSGSHHRFFVIQLINLEDFTLFLPFFSCRLMSWIDFMKGSGKHYSWHGTRSSLERRGLSWYKFVFSVINIFVLQHAVSWINELISTRKIIVWFFFFLLSEGVF